MPVKCRVRTLINWLLVLFYIYIKIYIMYITKIHIIYRITVYRETIYKNYIDFYIYIIQMLLTCIRGKNLERSQMMGC